MVVGILPSLATAFQISLSRAGGLVGFYALALAVGTPVLVLCLARIPRKALLLGLIAVFLAGNLVSALAGSYAVLLTGRMITTVAHGSFFAIGATVAAHLAPKGQAGKAIALMFAGLTLAMVIGVPLGSFIGNAANWRLPFSPSQRWPRWHGWQRCAWCPQLRFTLMARWRNNWRRCASPQF
ncbi:MFS transporter [Apirhabdus apintestini]|nr:MFS transporter [Enterobacteriaceae bacterium CA-0114]